LSSSDWHSFTTLYYVSVSRSIVSSSLFESDYKIHRKHRESKMNKKEKEGK